LLKEFLL
jgi:hypothetical protein